MVVLRCSQPGFPCLDTDAPVLRQINRRDERDTSRSNSPLKVADGAVFVDTTGLSTDQVVERLMQELRAVRVSEEKGG